MKHTCTLTLARTRTLAQAHAHAPAHRNGKRLSASLWAALPRREDGACVHGEAVGGHLQPLGQRRKDHRPRPRWWASAEGATGGARGLRGERRGVEALTVTRRRQHQGKKYLEHHVFIARVGWWYEFSRCHTAATGTQPSYTREATCSGTLRTRRVTRVYPKSSDQRVACSDSMACDPVDAHRRGPPHDVEARPTSHEGGRRHAQEACVCGGAGALGISRERAEGPTGRGGGAEGGPGWPQKVARGGQKNRHPV